MSDSIQAEPVLRIQTLGGFRAWLDNIELDSSNWRREKALHLFLFFVTMRQHGPLHKEDIINRLWPDLDADEGDRDFKVALHAVNKVLEPDRRPRTPPRFIERFDLTYGLSLSNVWIDSDAFEKAVAAGNKALPHDVEAAIAYHQEAVTLYKGDYLPERRYQDWCSFERERLQVLALGVMTSLADLLADRSPLESIRLTQHVLTIDPIWENAYRTQMKAYLAQGNRPLAIKTFAQCQTVLNEELGIDPLPETQALYQKIVNLK
jgi:DNA-binding SARP family transcriptional activator